VLAGSHREEVRSDEEVHGMSVRGRCGEGGLGVPEEGLEEFRGDAFWRLTAGSTLWNAFRSERSIGVSLPLSGR
jgi:hypothetical protein